MDIKQQVFKGTYGRKIYLPSEEFVYGKRNRTPTLMKKIVNYDYGREAESEIRHEYDQYMEQVIFFGIIFNSFIKKNREKKLKN